MDALNAWTSVLMVAKGGRKGTAGVVQGPGMVPGWVSVKWDTDQVVELVEIASLRVIS